MTSCKELRSRVEQLKGRRAQIRGSIMDVRRKRRVDKKALENYENAREVIREVGLKTQSQLSYHIGDVTSLALDSVFPDAYELLAEFVQRRNRTECDLLFQRDGLKIDPLSAAGGGAVDVASFAIRVASWSMQHPRSRNVLLLDEPFKHLSSALLLRAKDMLRQISEKLGVQIIFITHSEQLAEDADKIYRVSINSGRSIIREI